MTNLEYLASKGMMDADDSMCIVAHECKYNNECNGKLCEECEFNENFDLCVKTLLEEHREIKLTMAEKNILENVDKSFKWIVRDSVGYLCVYNGKPHKLANSWNLASGYSSLSPFNHLFQFIKWEDKEPYNIQEILDNCEVEENGR